MLQLLEIVISGEDQLGDLLVTFIINSNKNSDSLLPNRCDIEMEAKLGPALFTI